MEPCNCPQLVRAVAARATSFLQEEVDIDVQGCEFHLEDVLQLQLGYLTSLMSVECAQKLYLALSFDEPLILRAFERYTEDLEIDDAERSQYLEETAADLVNIIVGNATAAFSDSGAPAIQLSPPVLITQGKNIFRHKEAQFFRAMLHTEYGVLDVFCIGPKRLFDEKLNYIEESA
ncbi:chemotaxis protein CheX [Megalodesulfovibrio gigas]|uniref:Uncharacterized protein n=1 Tax=Megalodesulfovibrio gigas (strain ATCC 19364 / DSM 1382 / NCIMB 9332 / VKM B-1759) TaxID=1121448 RepID=T2G993_MEGG1|nr:chemotaxis protein CheX [Megalodesulfovibrio gigas]AGW12482.1 hypothetical protein DGI_0574 [Megalodesulfovibrio gigas DSM 1382 = ATCC 19364]